MNGKSQGSDDEPDWLRDFVVKKTMMSNSKKKKKFDKQIDPNVMIGSKDIDEGIDI